MLIALSCGKIFRLRSHLMWAETTLWLPRETCLQVKHARSPVTTDFQRIIRKTTNDSDCRNCVGLPQNCRLFEKGFIEVTLA